MMPEQKVDTADHRPDTYIDEDGIRVYRMSALGGCIRGLVACRLGLTPEPFSDETLGYMQQGVDVEDRLLTMAGVVPERRQVALRLEVAPGIEIRGTCDGVKMVEHLDFLAPLQGFIPVEAKGMGAANYEKWLRDVVRTPGSEMADWTNWQRYAWQVSCYAAALEAEEAVFVVGRRDDYDNHPTSLKTITPPYSIDDIRARVLEVERYATDETYPSCDVKTRWGCVWSAVHEVEDEVEFESDDPLIALCVRLLHTRDLREEADREYQLTRDAVDERMNLLDRKKAILPWGTVSRVVSMSKRVDTTALKKRYPEIAEELTVEKQVVTIRLTTNKGE